LDVTSIYQYGRMVGRFITTYAINAYHH